VTKVGQTLRRRRPDATGSEHHVMSHDFSFFHHH
jgi:hypothetical protein